MQLQPQCPKRLSQTSSITIQKTEFQINHRKKVINKQQVIVSLRRSASIFKKKIALNIGTKHQKSFKNQKLLRVSIQPILQSDWQCALMFRVFSSNWIKFQLVLFLVHTPVVTKHRTIKKKVGCDKNRREFAIAVQNVFSMLIYWHFDCFGQWHFDCLILQRCSIISMKLMQF